MHLKGNGNSLGTNDTPTLLLAYAVPSRNVKVISKPTTATLQAQTREQPWCRIWSCQQLKPCNGQKGDLKDPLSQPSHWCTGAELIRDSWSCLLTCSMPTSPQGVRGVLRSMPRLTDSSSCLRDKSQGRLASHQCHAQPEKVRSCMHDSLSHGIRPCMLQRGARRIVLVPCYAPACCLRRELKALIHCAGVLQWTSLTL